MCVIESQLTEPHPPIRHGWGQAGEYLEQEAAWAAFYEPQQLQDTADRLGGRGVELIPNREALLQAARAAGRSRVQELQAPVG